MSKIYQTPKGRGTGPTSIVLGVGITGLLFMAIPLTQIFNKYEKEPAEILSIDVAPPPPPPPPEEPPPPPEPEQEEPPPELNTPPPPISLAELDIALNPGTGGSLAGDFALPDFSATGEITSGIEGFDLADVDKKPIPTKQVEPRARGQKGTVILRFTVNEHGKTTNIEIHESTNPRLERSCIEAVRKWLFTPGEVGGRVVITHNVQQKFNFE